MPFYQTALLSDYVLIKLFCSLGNPTSNRPKKANAMLSRRRATAVIRANWWDGGRLEHLVSSLLLLHSARLKHLFTGQRWTMNLQMTVRLPRVALHFRAIQPLFSTSRPGRAMLATTVRSNRSSQIQRSRRATAAPTMRPNRSSQIQRSGRAIPATTVRPNPSSKIQRSGRALLATTVRPLFPNPAIKS